MVRFGILGAGNIAHRFAASLSNVENAQLTALSARSAEKAATFAEEFGVSPDHTYTSHADLLADSEVDAIYLALPHALHHEWAIAALRAGKAVLCEKPAMLTADEMSEVANVARQQGVLFMEAMKTRFVPIYNEVKQAMGEIGAIVRVEPSLCNDMLSLVEGSDSYHLNGGPGAGVLLDCGTYCASWIADASDAKPQLVGVAGETLNGVDVYADATLVCGTLTARLECAFDRAKSRTLTIEGTRGSIAVDDLHRPQRAVVRPYGKRDRVLEMPYEVDDLYGEIVHFVKLVEDGETESPVMSLDDSLRVAAILDAARAAFTVTPDALDVLAEQESVLRYDEQFGANEALELGCAIASLADGYDQGYVVRIVREADGYDLFSWGADGKRPDNYRFAEGKRQAALRLGGASVGGWLQAQLDGTQDELFSHDDMPVGGAFPIRVGDEWVATLCVSGLHEGRDHELVVRGLEKALNKKAPALPCVVA